MKWLKVVSVTVVVLLILIVILQNTESVETKIVFVSVSMPRVVLLTVTLLVGFWIGVVAANRMKRGAKTPADTGDTE